MFDRTTVLRILRPTVAGLAIAAVAIYLGVLVMLLVEQRDMLFVRGRYAHARDAIYQVRTIAERDGTRVTIWQAQPARAGAPSIVFFYGNAGTLSDFALIGEALHDAGYGIVLASYRGYPGNTGSPSEDGLMADARAILATVAKGPVVLWGQSLGTGVAAPWRPRDVARRSFCNRPIRQWPMSRRGGFRSIRCTG